MSLGPFLQNLDQSGVKFLSIFAVAGVPLTFLPCRCGSFSSIGLLFYPDRFGWVWSPPTVARDFFNSPAWRTGFGSPPFRTGFDSSSEEWEVVLVRRFGWFVDLPFRRCGLFPEGGLYMTPRCCGSFPGKDFP